MYVIGRNVFDFLMIRTRTLMSKKKIIIEVEKVTYECSLANATIFTNYEQALKVVNEIKNRKNEICFENDSILGEILDRGKDFDVDGLKVYRLVPQICE